MRPIDLDLPPKFATYRKHQENAILDLVSSNKRFSLFAGSTGSGKSLIYISLSRLLGGRTLVLVSTKGLQEQLMNDFHEIGMSDIRGQNNYECLAVYDELREYGTPGIGCDQGPCHVGVECGYKSEGGCLYYDAVRTAADSEIVVSNYYYWLTQGRYADPNSIGEFDLIILDEAHSAPDILADFCSVELEEYELRTLLDIDLPIEYGNDLSLWAAWAKEAAAVARHIYAEKKKSKGKTKELLRIMSLGRDLVEVGKVNAGEVDSDARWVCEIKKHSALFSPVWAHVYAEEYLYRGVNRVVLASATLSEGTGKYLGIPPHDSDYHEMPSGFDPGRRPLIYVPTTRVDRRMVEGQTRIWVNRIDSIIEGRLDRKGIIPAVSYNRAQEIIRRSKYSDIMLTHDSRNTQEVVERFKKADAPCVLVSPSIGTGYDFPEDECRYLIIVKIPFIDGRSPVIKARSKDDKDYLNYMAALNIIQYAGRGMRSAEDFCEIWVIDDHWKWFRKAYRFPNWFKAAWRIENTVREAIAIGDKK
jgi:Rad3-related DNA helicase